MSLRIVPLRPEHVEQVAEMVAVRYRAMRVQIPCAPSRFEDPEAIWPRLRAHVGNVPGVAALRGDELVGFCLSLLVNNRGERMAYVPDYGHAADSEGCYGIYRRMYAAIADRWLANGCFLHGITFYPHERPAIKAWFSVGFGLAVIDALQPLARQWGAARWPQGIEVRRGGSGDVDVVSALEIALDRHLSASPAYLPLLVEGGRRSWEQWLADESHALWLAFQEGEAVAYLRFEPSEGLVLPTASEETVAITGAYTRPDVRGRGIGTALLRCGFEACATPEGRSEGYTHCSVDFESANLPGSRFWLGSGFVSVCRSLMRRVDQRLSWANARRDAVDVLRAYEGQTWIG
jgi:GNAT superfamily N-acetyltransferase